jgi:hypothetical protein
MRDSLEEPITPGPGRHELLAASLHGDDRLGVGVIG